MRPFSALANTANINVSSSSQNVLVTANGGISEVRVMNDGTATVWIAFGTTSAVVATLAASIPVPAGAIEVLSVADGPIYAAAIAAGSTGKIYFTAGGGF